MEPELVTNKMREHIVISSVVLQYLNAAIRLNISYEVDNMTYLDWILAFAARNKRPHFLNWVLYYILKGIFHIPQIPFSI